MQTATLTPTPTITDVSEIVIPPTMSDTISARPDSAPLLVATIDLDPFQRSFLPENVWWSEDSQVLYYQDIETQEAWAYDLSTGISASVTYVPRSLRELEPQIQATLPDNASIVSLSPYNHFVLYRLPLAEPILIPDDPFINPTPEVRLPNHYTAELWLHREGQDFNLGLVDNCFASLFPPLWSANEDIAIINTAGSPHMMCLYSVWFVDLATLSLGPLVSSWKENYRVLDLSENGDIFLIRSYTDRLNYLYDSTTNEQWPISVNDSDRMMLVNTSQSPSCLVFELSFSETTLRDHVSYCQPTTGDVTFLATIEGQVSQAVVSPDKKFIALMTVNDFPMGNFYQDIRPSIWLLALP